MFTVVAFSESIDCAGVFTKIAGVPDQHVKVAGDGIYVGEYNRVMGALAAIGATGVEARLVSPSLRRVNPHYIAPIENSIDIDGNPNHTVNNRVSIPLDTNEALEAEVVADPAAPEQIAMAVWLAMGGITPVEGKIITVNANITITLVAGAWAFAEIDFVDELPVGNYDVVGLRAVVPTGVVARFVPVAASHRPGCPCVASKEFNDGKIFRFGNLGPWFTFNTVQPPGIEILGSAADAEDTYELYIDILER